MGPHTVPVARIGAARDEMSRKTEILKDTKMPESDRAGPDDKCARVPHGAAFELVE